MKKLIIISALAVSATAFANDREYCRPMGEGAEVAMQVRQSGVPMRKVYRYGATDDGIILMNNLMELAWTTPFIEDEYAKKVAIDNFKEKFWKACIKYQQTGSFE